MGWLKGNNNLKPTAQPLTSSACVPCVVNHNIFDREQSGHFLTAEHFEAQV